MNMQYPEDGDYSFLGSGGGLTDKELRAEEMRLNNLRSEKMNPSKKNN